MASDIPDRGMLSSDSRLIPPPNLHRALEEAEVQAKKGGRWNDFQTTHVFLRAWAGVIEDIGNYRQHGSDDYQHSISYRIILHRVLMTLQQLGHQQALAWLLSEVDRLDQIFLERSTYDVESLILRPEKRNPAYWFLRRLPNDANVIEHLKMIQPADP